MSDLSLGPLFGQLRAKSGELGITTYSVSQPTLEQVFLRLAKEQEELEAAQGD